MPQLLTVLVVMDQRGIGLAVRLLVNVVFAPSYVPTATNVPSDRRSV